MDQNTKTLNPASMNVTYRTPPNYFSPPGNQQLAYGSDFEIRASKKPRTIQHCLQFRRGRCNYGNKCVFSHTMRDAEKAPLPPLMLNVGRNSKQEHRVITEKGFCWKFCNGEECLDGKLCRYRHAMPFNLGRSSSANTRGVGHFTRNGVGDQLQSRTPECIDILGQSVSQRPVFTKIKLCNNWEARSSCPYGVNCIFAHGHAELGKIWTRTETVCGNVSTTKIMSSSASTLQSVCRMKSALKQQSREEMRPFKWRSFEKMNGIYADWIDDEAFMVSSLRKVENSN